MTDRTRTLAALVEWYAEVVLLLGMAVLVILAALLVVSPFQLMSGERWSEVVIDVDIGEGSVIPVVPLEPKCELGFSV